jgi:hypothetical protein
LSTRFGQFLEQAGKFEGPLPVAKVIAPPAATVMVMVY